MPNILNIYIGAKYVSTRVTRFTYSSVNIFLFNNNRVSSLMVHRSRLDRFEHLVF